MQLTANTTYAVVDLETTGTSVQRGDRIIQIGCVFVRNQRIIKQVSYLVNPNRDIPAEILRLTHLNAKAVEQAPSFEEIAPELSSLLRNAVFVAHNINFDLPFLNHEFERVGFSTLDNWGLDTVELSQILYPTAMSYKLSDLSRMLSIEHDSPHQADDDALVTAKLLIKLIDRMYEIPNEMLDTLNKLSMHLIRQTGKLFEFVADTKPKTQLSDDFIYRKGLILRKNRKSVESLSSPADFPVTDKEKRQALKKVGLQFRKTQANMIDTVMENYQSKLDIKPMIIEAPTGSGKTLGYLWPLSNLRKSGQKIVISTSTSVLQNQILNDTLPIVNRLNNRTLNGALVKSTSNYLDLFHFYQSLSWNDINQQTAILQMKIIVWLAMTETGNIEELHLTNYNAPLFNYIHHVPHEKLVTDNPFYDVDFVRQLHEQQTNAQVLVTNHAYLMAHPKDKIFGDNPLLVVDEAHHLIQGTLSAYSNKLNFSHINRWISNLVELISRTQKKSMSEIFADNIMVNYQLTSLLSALQQLRNKIEDLQVDLFTTFIQNNVPRDERNGYFNQILKPQQNEKIRDFTKPIQQIKNLVLDIIKVNLRILEFVEKNEAVFVPSDLTVIEEFNQETQKLKSYHERIELFLSKLEGDETFSFYLSMTNYGTLESLNIGWQLLHPAKKIQSVFAQFEPPLLTGATLTVNHRFNYLASGLGYSDHNQLIEKKIRSSFNYKKQAHLWLVDDFPNPNQLSTGAYEHKLADAIYQISKNNHKQTMVLFNSLTTLSGVYQNIIHTDLVNDREILAQGITGSTSKILKRFALGSDTLLLGSNSFYEGVDFPNKQLEVLIMTRLPFDSPDQLSVRLADIALRREHRNPFKDSSLPNAIIRLRQGFGRLIRTKKDRGTFVIFDSRILHAKYGNKMLNSLPKSLPKTQINQKKLRAAINDFFDKKD